MMIRPCKPRDSARPALLTAVRSRLSGLAVYPRRVLHGLAAPDWRGDHACRARVVVRKDRRRTSTASSPSSGARVGLQTATLASKSAVRDAPYAPLSSAAATSYVPLV